MADKAEAQDAQDVAEAAWADALHAATLFAVDPVGTGGVVLRSLAGPQRERWLGWLRGVLPAAAPVRRVPLHIHDARLLGGLDLAATLRAGRPVAERGLIAEADGGVLLLAMAERLPAGTAARLAAVIDTQEVVMERDGLTLRQPARVGVVALDEGLADDEQLPAALRDRCAFHLPLEWLPSRRKSGARGGAEGAAANGVAGGSARGLAGGLAGGFGSGGAGVDESVADLRDDVAAARVRLPQVRASDELLQALCAAAMALGVHSARAPLLALRVARAAAALDGRDEVNERDAALAARLVLAPRATQMPTVAADAAEPDGTDGTDADDADNPPPQDSAPPPQPDTAPEPPAAEPEPELEPEPPVDAAADDPPNEDEPPPLDPGTLDDLILDAARAAIPAGLLAALKLGQAGTARSASAGRAGQVKHNRLRGRPSGVRRGEPRAGARLNVIETLRAAAPWQAVRRREVQAREGTGSAAGRAGAGVSAKTNASDPARSGPAAHAPHAARIQVRREDFHVTRYQQHGETTTVFIVDASGSAALNRLAEAKGAVELLLADCYVRRDRVAVLAFRGKTAELLLPPTRSLVRAKRSLAGLPGGGGTPLAAGIDAALALADSIQRRGETPILVLLTDGRGNIARDGTPGRKQAGDDALAAARQVRLAGVTALLLDTSPQPQPAAEQLAAAMGAGYLPLPYAGAAALSTAVRLATAPPAGRGAGA